MPWLVKFFINTEAVAFYSLALNAVAFLESFMPLAGLSSILGLKADNRNEMAFIFKRSFKYALWIGVLLSLIGFVLLPLVLGFIFPKYTDSIPVLRVMLLALPFYGIYKILKSTLSVLREHRVLAMRILNEMLILLLGPVILLPAAGLAGAGLIYIAMYVERSWFFYRELVGKYRDFRIKARHLVEFDEVDKIFLVKGIRSFLRVVKSFSPWK